MVCKGCGTNCKCSDSKCGDNCSCNQDCKCVCKTGTKEQCCSTKTT
ncbi:metallothionein-3 [Drosophila mojavensis]|uniref:Metallothionein C n=2 Tax=mojavensis species complex TaxID=198037 RepID=B4K7T0_DROMO|nr:metallothionein-3 [Drosophila mojavensis]XP_017856968.1 PREDICTED: metallothionein-3 [Drosophila arizonae]EDW16451.1 metallothionein C [Drosophila mojavensis]